MRCSIKNTYLGLGNRNDGGVPGGLLRGGMSRHVSRGRGSRWDNGVAVPDREYQGLTLGKLDI